MAEARIDAAAAAVRIVESLESDLRTAIARCQAAQAVKELAQSMVTERQRIRSEMEKARRESVTATKDEALKRDRRRRCFI